MEAQDSTKDKKILKKDSVEVAYEGNEAMNEEIEEALNEPPRDPSILQQIQYQLPKEEPTQYKYLKPSVRIKTGMFKEEFDLRFDELRNTMVTKGMITAITTFYPQIKKFAKQNPHIKRQPKKKDKEELEKELPMMKPDFSVVDVNNIKYTWIGHSTAVIQIGPDNFIIDPVFSERASPSQLVGPKRFRPPACTIPELPRINVVLISHDHYDHLDEVALKSLHKCFDPLFVAGIGTENVLPKKANSLLMDWMQFSTVGINGRNYRITFVPVCHWSKRGVSDLNTRLWGGFVIQTPQNKKIFYSGDTGYCPVFKQIGKMFGPFDFTILPIGAYEPRILLTPQHVNPEEAVIIHREMRSKQSVGVHWGTFPLGAEGFYQARTDLAQARKKHNMPDQEFITVFHGQSFVFRSK